MEHFLKEGGIFSTDQTRVHLFLGEGTWSSSPDSRALFLPDFFLEDEKPWLHFSRKEEVSLSQVKHIVSPLAGSIPSILWKEGKKELFAHFFQRIQEEIAKEALHKGVPYSFTVGKGKISEKVLAALLLSLIRYAETAPVHLYGFWKEGKGMLGATPEILFTQKGSEIETVACAGTRNAAASSEEFLSDPKERREHNLVIEGIEKALSPFGQLTKRPTVEKRLPHLTHLVTPITLALSEQPRFDEIVSALHPTPALGTYPKEEGSAWLKECAALLPRRRYGAPVGLCDSENEEAACVVAIRNIQWEGDQISIGGGCGVVRESSLEKEWEERGRKIASVKKIFSFRACP